MLIYLGRIDRRDRTPGNEPGGKQQRESLRSKGENIMDQTLINVLIWERELEVERLVKQQSYFRSEAPQADGPWPRQESRWSFLFELFRAGKSRKQAAQGC
jgi:hypothetical protein